jgi:hypothetical protein
MPDELKKGDKVEWNAHGGKTTAKGKAVGRVIRKLTKPTKIKSHEVKASPENPEYLVKSDKSGGEAAHKPSALRKVD